MASLIDALSDATLLDTEGRLSVLEARWHQMSGRERIYALIDVAMRLGRLSTPSNRAAVDAMTQRFRRLEGVLLRGRPHV
jgi:hypothetical protein